MREQDRRRGALVLRAERDRDLAGGLDRRRRPSRTSARVVGTASPSVCRGSSCCSRGRSATSAPPGVANSEPSPIFLPSGVNSSWRSDRVSGSPCSSRRAFAYVSRLRMRPPLASVPIDCQPLLTVAMSGPFGSARRRLSVFITWPQSWVVRLMVMFGYFFSKSLTIGVHPLAFVALPEVEDLECDRLAGHVFRDGLGRSPRGGSAWCAGRQAQGQSDRQSNRSDEVLASSSSLL